MSLTRSLLETLFFLTNLLEVSMQRDFGALQGVLACQTSMCYIRMEYVPSVSFNAGADAMVAIVHTYAVPYVTVISSVRYRNTTHNY